MSIIDNTNNYKTLFNEYLNILSKCDTFKFRCEEIFSRSSFLNEAEMKTLVILIDNAIDEIPEFESIRRKLLLRQIDCQEFLDSVNELKSLMN